MRKPAHQIEKPSRCASLPLDTRLKWLTIACIAAMGCNAHDPRADENTPWSEFAIGDPGTSKTTLEQNGKFEFRGYLPATSSEGQTQRIAGARVLGFDQDRSIAFCG